MIRLSNIWIEIRDLASENWLGYSCRKIDLKESGLWNSDYVRESYDRIFLIALEHHISPEDALSLMKKNE